MFLHSPDFSSHFPIQAFLIPKSISISSSASSLVALLRQQRYHLGKIGTSENMSMSTSKMLFWWNIANHFNSSQYHLFRNQSLRQQTRSRWFSCFIYSNIVILISERSQKWCLRRVKTTNKNRMHATAVLFVFWRFLPYSLYTGLSLVYFISINDERFDYRPPNALNYNLKIYDHFCHSSLGFILGSLLEERKILRISACEFSEYAAGKVPNNTSPSQDNTLEALCYLKVVIDVMKL